jgi:hypothetical protein
MKSIGDVELQIVIHRRRSGRRRANSSGDQNFQLKLEVDQPGVPDSCAEMALNRRLCQKNSGSMMRKNASVTNGGSFLRSRNSAKPKKPNPTPHNAIEERTKKRRSGIDLHLR